MKNKWAAVATMGCALTVSLASFAGIGEAKADQSPWMIRGRAIVIMPDESAKVSPIGGSVKINDQVVPELDISYFFEKHWAAELILATSQHHITHTPTGLNLGKTWVLPPTVTLQYHINPDSPSFRPYIGAGINYTKFYSQSGADPAVTNIKLKDSVGLALQAGFDIPINDHWTFNVDVKKIFMNTKSTIELAGPTTVRADVDIDPLVVGVGFGYRF
jgi:outer membrane protein